MMYEIPSWATKSFQNGYRPLKGCVCLVALVKVLSNVEKSLCSIHSISKLTLSVAYTEGPNSLQTFFLPNAGIVNKFFLV